MSQHRLLFYSNLSRSGTTVELNEDGNMVTLHDFAPGSLGAFTHIVGMT